jgi:D-arabinose 1-dehydrogenase-like Zn-dependent alcohol dehydrogenase
VLTTASAPSSFAKFNLSSLISKATTLGNLALQYAKNVFNAKVVAFDISDDKLNFAKELGADAVVNTKNQDAVEEVNKLTDEKGLDATVKFNLSSLISKATTLALNTFFAYCNAKLPKPPIPNIPIH